MGEEAGISVILLVLAIGHLSADVTQWAIEANLRHGTDEAARNPPGGQDIARRPVDEWVEPQAVAKARGSPWPLEDQRRERPAFSRLPIDFSVNHPPWCVACRRSAPPRYAERTRPYEDHF